MTTQVTIEIETAPGVWTDISADLRGNPIVITRGRSDEQSQASPQRMSFTLDNRTGKFSLRNPLSPLFGKIGRNTQVRCKINNEAFTRFYGEIPSWPPNWDPSHADHYVSIEANGMLRRMGQGQPPVSSALRDYILAQSTLAAYYPLSGGEETVYSQNVVPGKTGTFKGLNSPSFRYGVDMSAAWLGTGMELNDAPAPSYMQGDGNATGSNAAFDFVFQSSALGVLDLQLFPTLDSYWRVRLNTSADAGTLQVTYYDDVNGLLTETASAAVPALQDTLIHTCRFELQTVAGPNVNYLVYIDGVLIDSGTNSLGQTLTQVPLFRFNYDRFTGQTVTNMAHLTLWADNTAANMPSVVDFTEAAFAYAGETAIARITRVCADGDIPLLTHGSTSAAMGPQYTETRLEQIRDCETADLGILVEARNAPGLEYFACSSLYNQGDAFTLNYVGEVSPPLEPVDDDQVTRNDVTATRREGGSVRRTIDVGPLSTLDPPLGVGRYDTEVTVNVESDEQLDGVASWVANIGTLDKARWPSVTVILSNLPDGDIVLDADIGDRFTITGMSKAFVFDDVSLIIVGYTETIDTFMHTITFICAPAEPYEVFVVESTGSRISSGETSLTNATMTTTATSMSLLSADAVTLWTTAGGDMPIPVMVAGEAMSIAAISGTTPGVAQTATVVRSVNGVVKTHSSGEIVRLKRRAVLAL